MKRPWLTTPSGQRFTMWLGIVLALVALVPLSLQLSMEAKRLEVSQLDRTAVRFYPIETLTSVEELAGMEVLPEYSALETKFGTTVTIEVVNHGRLVGKREVWAKLYSPRGKLREGMKIWLELKPSGRNKLEFFFTGTEAELRESKIHLGF